VKRFRPSLRRVVSVAAAGIAGAAATLFFATPAFAHHVNTKGTATCDPAGGWSVAWEVYSPGTWKPYYKILTASSSPLSGSISGELGSLATEYKPVNQKFTGTQHFAADVASATLTATARFSTSSTEDVNIAGGGTDIKTKVDRPNCGAAPSVAFASNCDDSVTVTLDNQQGNAPATFNVKGTDKAVNGGQTVEVNVPSTGDVVVKLAGHADWSYTWSASNQCAPSPSLANTGSSLTTPLSVGAALLAAGVGVIALVFRMRRRRSLAGQ
jgi:hypothetical protein